MAKEKEIKVLEEAERTEFTEEEVAKGMLETSTGKRKVSVPGLGDVTLKHPTREDELEADVERSKAFTRFLLDGLKTEAEMKKIAEERGLWTEKDEEALGKLQTDMVDIRVEISQVKSGTKKKKLQKELLETRVKWIEELARKNAIFAHTVENKATNTWWQYLTFRCAFKADDEPVWDTWDDFLKESNSDPSTVLVGEFLTFYNGLSDNFFDLWVGEETKSPESGE